VGYTQAELKAELESSNHTISFTLHGRSQASSEAKRCNRKFFLPTFSQFEKDYKFFEGCILTTYAAVVQATAQRSPCRTSDLKDADFLMVPPYSALECNWPGYGGGKCDSHANAYRRGYYKCRKEVAQVASDLRKKHKGKQVLVVDTTSSWDVYISKEYYVDEGTIWAKGNSLPPYYRKGLDISLPPPSVSRCSETPSIAYDEPISKKMWFMSFMGKMYATDFRETGIIRQTLKRLYNGRKVKDKRIVVESTMGSSFDFDQLLQNSIFNLILRGDVEFSYRFNEAVCSGGVPVLVTDKWIPPFNEFLPFQSYGVLVLEKDIGELVNILAALPDSKVEQLRKNSRKACKTSFSATEVSVNALLAHLTTK